MIFVTVSITLTAMVEDVGIIDVVLKRSLEAFKCLLNVALLHVNARELDPALSQARNKRNGSLKIFLRTRNVARQKPRR